MIIHYRCPQCSEPLQHDNNSLRCTNGHCFDIAREGYVNLHLVQHKNSKQPGDDVDMLRSRQAFLEKYHYQPLVEQLSVMFEGKLGVEKLLLDIGCGEGYYLQQLCQRFGCKGLGIDIAKDGVRMAAKRRFGAQLAVCSSAKLPYFDNTIDTALCIFSPINIEETKRVLEPGGNLIMVGPGERHLQELAALIYGEAQVHSANFDDFSSKGMEPRECSGLEFELNLNQEDALNLLRMTPYYWRCPEELKQSLGAKLPKLTCHFQINCYIFQ